MALAQRNNHALAEHSLVLNRAVMGYLQGIKVIRSYLREESGYDRAKEAVLRGAQLQDATTSRPLRWLVAAMSVATALAVALLIPGAGLGYVSGEVDLATRHGRPRRAAQATRARFPQQAMYQDRSSGLSRV